MTNKKQRVDSAKGASEAMQDAFAKVEPPAHIKINERVRPFWDSVVSARRASRWNDADLEIAANLAKTKCKIEQINEELELEGDIVTNEKGTPIPNPKHRLLNELSQRCVTLSRLLHVHAEATQGKAGKQVKGNQEVESMKGKTAKVDGLIARPH